MLSNQMTRSQTAVEQLSSACATAVPSGATTRSRGVDVARNQAFAGMQGRLAPVTPFRTTASLRHLNADIAAANDRPPRGVPR